MPTSRVSSMRMGTQSAEDSKQLEEEEGSGKEDPEKRVSYFSLSGITGMRFSTPPRGTRRHRRLNSDLRLKRQKMFETSSEWVLEFDRSWGAIGRCKRLLEHGARSAHSSAVSLPRQI